MAPTLELLQEKLGARALAVAAGVDMPVVRIVAAELLGIVDTLVQDFGYDLLLDVTAIDWQGEAERFEVVWHFYSTRHFGRLRVKTRVREDAPVVDSLVPLFGSAGYAEREAHEMFGIVFRGNLDLRPILLYEGFVGHPLRKDYPKEQEQPLVPYRT